jgi:hypothetical protein
LLEAVQVDVVNIDPILSQTVTVEVFDWGVDPVSGNPAPVVVNPPNPVTIGPHSHQSFTVPLTASIFSRPRHFYEIRVTIPDDPQLMVNCFAFGLNGTVIAGNTVLHEELAKIAGPMQNLPPVPPTNPSRYYLGLDRSAPNNPKWQFYTWIDVVRDFGAVGDGIHDDTTAIQNALNVFSGLNKAGVIYLPLTPDGGFYKITQKLTYVGNAAAPIRLAGDVCGQESPFGSTLHWAGTDGGTLLEITGGQNLIIENLLLYGGARSATTGARFGLVLQMTPGGAGVANVTLRNLEVSGVTGPGSACIVLGTNNFQTDSITLDKVRCAGYMPTATSTATNYGITTGFANSKNFTLISPHIAGCMVGFHCPSEGFSYVLILAPNFGVNFLADVQHGTGLLAIKGGGSEGSARLYDTLGGGTNSSHLSIEDVYFAGSAPADDYIIRCHGSLRLIGCQLMNGRTGSSLPKVKMGELGPPTKYSLFARNNIFWNAVTDPPYYDASDVLLASGQSTDPNLRYDYALDIADDNSASQQHLSARASL